MAALGDLVPARSCASRRRGPWRASAERRNQPWDYPVLGSRQRFVRPQSCGRRRPRLRPDESPPSPEPEPATPRRPTPPRFMPAPTATAPAEWRVVPRRRFTPRSRLRRPIGSTHRSWQRHALQLASRRSSLAGPGHPAHSREVSDAGLPASTHDLSGPHAGELASDTSHAGSANLACDSARVELSATRATPGGASTSVSAACSPDAPSQTARRDRRRRRPFDSGGPF